MAQTNKQKVQIAAIMGDDPSSTPIQCEAPGCNNQIALKDSCSMAIVYRMPGLGKSPYQCDDEQHFGCSHEHAILAMLTCLFEHIDTGDHAAQQTEEEILTILKNHLTERKQ